MMISETGWSLRERHERGFRLLNHHIIVQETWPLYEIQNSHIQKIQQTLEFLSFLSFLSIPARQIANNQQQPVHVALLKLAIKYYWVKICTKTCTNLTFSPSSLLFSMSGHQSSLRRFYHLLTNPYCTVVC